MSADTDMVKLKACPFCGGPVELEQTIDGRKWWGVVCRNTMGRGGTCAIQQRPSGSKEAAIERWNTRAALDASGIGEMVGLVEESLYHLRLDDRAKDYHNRALAALSRARATVGNRDG